MHVFAVAALALAQPVFAATFDTATFNDPMAVATPKAKTAIAIEKRPAETRKKSKWDPSAREEIQAIRRALEGVQVLLNSKPGPQVRDQLLLNRANLWIRWVREVMRRRDDTPKASQDADRRPLHTAISDMASLLNHPSLEMRSKARYLQALALIYLDRPSEARVKLSEVLVENPNHENIGWIAIFIAEDLFEQQKFEEAARYYRDYMSKMSRSHQEIARYKLAWCSLHLGRIADAEKLFTFLIRSNPTDGFGKDSVRDLAFMVARYTPDRDFFELATSILEEKSQKISFLDSVRMTLQAQGSSEALERLVFQMEKLEPSVQRRLELFVSKLKVNRKDFVARSHQRAFEDLRAYIQQQKLSAKSSAFMAIAPELEYEVRHLMRNSVETFAGRLRTPEDIKKGELSFSIQSLFSFYLTFYPKSAARGTTLGLWLDVCEDTREYSCIDRVADFIQRDRSVPSSLQERAAVDQLAALEAWLEILKSDPRDDLRMKTREKFLVRLAQFHQARPQSGVWGKISRRYSELLVEAKEHSRAIQVLERVYQQEKQDPKLALDLFYRIQWIRFESKQHKALIDDPRMNGYETKDARLQDFRKESSLALAVAAREAEDYTAFGTRLLDFLRLNRDPKKREIALSDLFSTWLTQGMDEPALKVALPLSPAERWSPPFQAAMGQLWRKRMMVGDFAGAQAVLVGAPVEENEKGALTRFTASGEVPSGWKGIGKAQKSYFLGVAALTRPELLLRKDLNSALATAEERALLELAQRVRRGTWEEAKVIPPSQVLSSLKRLELPERRTPEAQYSSMLQKAVEQVREARNKIPAELTQQLPEIRIELLELAEESEIKVSKAILASPRPAGLGEAQVQEYNTQIDALAREFTDQAKEFSKTRTALEERYAKESKEKSDLHPPKVDPRDWKWPEFERKHLLAMRKLAQSGDLLGAYVILDLLKGDQERKPAVSQDEYYRLRVGLAFDAKANEALRRQLGDELRAAGLTDLLDDWRRAGR